MTDQPEKIDLADMNRRTVDNELLQELRDLFARAEEQKERYDFTWNGKAKAYFEAATPTTKTLRPQPEESYIYADDEYKEKINTFDDSENLFITGDNLDALKLLQESYLGKIDMIYIDPPYNTGKDFVYHDNFKQTQKVADVAEGNVDEEGNRLVKNERSAGRFHSDWLSMMYPRLKLARNLLSDTGVIFVSIDDNEQANLKLLMDEVFGEDNFVGNFIRRTINSGKQDSQTVAVYHEYLLVYVKTGKAVFNRREKSIKERLKLYPLEDNHIESRGRYYVSQLDKGSLQYSDALNYPIASPEGTKIWPGEGFEDKSKIFRWGKEKVKWGLENDYIVFKKQKDGWKVYAKSYEFRDNNNNVINPSNPYTTLDYVSKDYSNFNATPELKKIFEGKNYFDFPKPVPFIEDLLRYATNKSGLVLDFFAGSATTAEAVIKLNAEDDGNRQWILCTLDETTNEKSDARKSGYSTIDQISRERIRRAAKKLDDKKGFRAIKVDNVGMNKDVFKTADDLSQDAILLDLDNKVDARTDYDLLYDVLVDGALEYNRQVAKETIGNAEIIKYDYLGELSGVIAYFGDELTDDLTRNIAKMQPLIAVFKELTFNESAEKVNVLEQFRSLSPDTKVKVI
ncbi:MAG: site-specific DNA-methyltransferase [Lactobacillaceae bacterium]|jgi:adenine-specific DNA-methyltransferase|nr:site-specific DNA-methyltransferase [Lactobacillaceae bacterium]